MTAPERCLRVVEHRGRAGLDQLAGDWRRLSAAMATSTAFHTYETHVAYVDHLAVAPERLRYVVLADGREVRAICPLEARTDRTLGIPIPVWGAPWHPHWPLADVICPENEVRQACGRRSPNTLDETPWAVVCWSSVRCRRTRYSGMA